MMYKDKRDLKFFLKEKTLWITLNRPAFSNAFSDEMIEDLVATLYAADEDNEVRSIVITGEGKHFCAGGDVKSMLAKTGMFAGEPNELRERYQRGIQKIPVCMEALSTPTIAMVNGAAIGAGLDFACMCDIRVASEKAKFGETFAKLGLIPGDGGTFFLQRIIGFAKAMELSLTAEVIDANKALEIGLVNYVANEEMILDLTNRIVGKINQNAPIAIQMLKKAIRQAYRSDLKSNLDLLSAYQGITQNSSDHQKALQGLFDKNNVDFDHH